MTSKSPHSPFTCCGVRNASPDGRIAFLSNREADHWRSLMVGVYAVSANGGAAEPERVDGGRERAAQRVQLAVDLDPQRLESPLRGVTAGAP